MAQGASILNVQIFELHSLQLYTMSSCCVAFFKRSVSVYDLLIIIILYWPTLQPFNNDPVFRYQFYVDFYFHLSFVHFYWIFVFSTRPNRNWLPSSTKMCVRWYCAKRSKPENILEGVTSTPNLFQKTWPMPS